MRVLYFNLESISTSQIRNPAPTHTEGAFYNIIFYPKKMIIK